MVLNKQIIVFLLLSCLTLKSLFGMPFQESLENPSQMYELSYEDNLEDQVGRSKREEMDMVNGIKTNVRKPLIFKRATNVRKPLMFKRYTDQELNKLWYPVSGRLNY